MVDLTPFLPGLSPVQGKAVVARFDGGRLSSEGGLLALREIERRLGLADRLASCLVDPRAPERVVHRLAEIIRFRMLMIAAGYEDGNDADALRRDPMFKLALDRLPAGEELCSQSTISRLENLPDRRALLRLGRALVEQYCGSFRTVPKRIVLDIDDTPPLSRGQALRPRAWRPATAPVQRLLRRLRLPADRCVRRRGPLCHRAAAARQAAERGGDPRLGAPPGRRPAQPLAKGRDPAARRQPLCVPGGVRLVPEEPGGLGLRPGPQRRTLPSCRGIGEEHRRALQGGARARQGAALRAIP